MGTPESGYKARLDELAEEVQQQVEQWAAARARAEGGPVKIEYGFSGSVTMTPPAKRPAEEEKQG